MAAARDFRNPKPPAKPQAKPQAKQLGDLLSGILDPVLRKRAGISLSLLQSWEEVVGPVASERSRPEKLVWPRKAGSHDALSAATLVIACEPSAALELQHETTEIIARVNAFLGLSAVGKVKLVQKPIPASDKPKRRLRALNGIERAAISRLTARIDDAELRASLERLGASMKASRRATPTG